MGVRAERQGQMYRILGSPHSIATETHHGQRTVGRLPQSGETATVTEEAPAPAPEPEARSCAREQRRR